MHSRSRPLAPMPPPPPLLLLLVLVVLPAIALAAGHHHRHRNDPAKHEADDHGDDHENKTISPYNGHSLFDLSTLGVLAALKIKFVVVVLIGVAVFVLLTKGYNTKCLFGNCRPNYSTYGYYPYVDYTYVGYEVPAGAAAAYRRPTVVAAGPVVGVGAKHSHHLTDLTARVWNSIDIAGMAFSALNIQEDDCRRKLVCQADRAADSNPLLRAALSWFSTSLARYRTDRSRQGAGLGDGDADGIEWRREEQDPCEELYPRCLHRDLLPALGGPDPSIHPLHHVELSEHDLLALREPLAQPLGEPWRATDFHHEYRYEYPHHHHQHLHHPPPFRGEGGDVPGAPAPVGAADLDALYPALASPTFASPPTATSYAAALAGAAATPSSATVLAPAPVHEETPVTALANASTSASSAGLSPFPSAPTSGSPGGPPEPRSPWSPSPTSAAPTLLTPLTPAAHSRGAGGSAAPGATAGTTEPAPAPAPLVWRRVLFGNRSKLHYE